MAVKIGDKIYRNEQEQVRKNMEDIEALKGKIKDVFKTTATLTSSSVSVALVDTNVTDEEEGWLMSDDGLLFAITGNDGTNLLISYYSDLKGPQGDPGAALNIDDNIESLTKVWSSKKTSDSIKALLDDNTISNSKTWSSDFIRTMNDKGIYYTTVAPTLVSGNDYELATTDLVNTMATSTVKARDLVIYINNSAKADSLYYINYAHEPLELVKIAEFSQGSKSYTHNIKISSGTNDENYHFNITIVNTDNTPFTYATFTKWFEDNMTRGQHFKECSGFCHMYSTNYAIDGIALQTGTRYDLFNMSCYNIANGSWSDSVQMQLLDSSTKWAMEDKVTE